MVRKSYRSTLPDRLRRRVRTSRYEPLLWSLAATGAGVVAAVLMRRLMAVLWQGVLDEPPPKTPTAAGAGWSAAVGWALLSGAMAGLGRLVGRRGAASAWRRLLDAEPPGS